MLSIVSLQWKITGVGPLTDTPNYFNWTFADTVNFNPKQSGRSPDSTSQEQGRQQARAFISPGFEI
jgi:hypothetical protein